MIDLSNQIILTTAAAAGIGHAVTLRLLEGGATVVATDVDAAGLERLVRDATSLGYAKRLTERVMDATDEQEIRDCIASRSDWTGLYNGVGWVHEGTLASTSREDWDKSWSINVTSLFLTCQAILPSFIENGGGAIVNVSSVASSHNPIPNRLAYSATKEAILGLTKSLAADYVSQGVRVNAICPGTVESPSLHARINAANDPKAAMQNFIDRQPVGRLGQPSEMAEVVAFLLSDNAAYVTGTHFVLDGGLTM